MSCLLSLNHPKVALIVRELQQLGIQVSFVETGYTERMEEEVSFQPPTVLDIREDRFAASVINSKGAAVSANVFNEELNNYYKECEKICLTVSDRLNITPTTIRFRRYIIQLLITFWDDFFKNHPEIDCILFMEAPHTGHDIVMYFAAKKYSVQVWYPEPVKIGCLYLMRDSYNDLSSEKVPNEFLQGSSKNELILKLGRHFEPDYIDKNSVISIENALTLYEEQQKIKNKKLHKVNLVSITKVIAKLLSVIRYFFKTRELSLFDYSRGKTSILYFNLQAFIQRRKILRMKKFYQDNCSKVNFKENYIFYAMHLQPERTSSPFLSGEYEDQSFAVETLAKSLPEGWILYIKEHPHIFMNSVFARTDFELLHSVAQINYRDINYYKRLLSFKNIRFVGLNQEANTLQKHAKFTATSTGSVGWSSMYFHHKPALVFGYPWYAGCNSCFRVNSIQSCIQAINEGAKKSGEEVERDVLKFLIYNKPRFEYLTDYYHTAFNHGKSNRMVHKVGMVFAHYIGQSKAQIEKNLQRKRKNMVA